MLTIVVAPIVEKFDDRISEFVEEAVMEESVTLNLEHSLISLSKWESIYEKPFMSTDDKSHEEIVGYVKCMNMSRNTSEEVFDRLSEKNFEEINEYIGRKMTATWFRESRGAPKSREVITAELIYYWMTVYHIPFECERWHLNRLLTLIRVCNTKEAKPKKMGRRQALSMQRALNEERRAKLGTTG